MATTDRLQGVTGGTAIKSPVLAASTGDLTLSSTQVVDGIALSSCDRILVKDQSDASENGIYEVDTSTWSRTKDFDGSRDVVEGTIIYVTNGTVNSNTWWRVSSTGDNIPGTNDISFTQASAPTSLTTLTGVLDTSDNAINESEGSAVASASTTNVWATDGNTLHVTGGVTITSFGEAPRIGAIRRLVFDSTLVLTHAAATLILPGSTNVVTAAGDAAVMYADSTTQIRCIDYQRASGRSVVRTEPFETASSSGATFTSSGVTVVSSATSTASTFSVASPISGQIKQVLIETTATAITLDSTAASITFASSGGASSTSLTYAGTNARGGSVVLMGRGSTRWHVLSKTDGWT